MLRDLLPRRVRDLGTWTIVMALVLLGSGVWLLLSDLPPVVVSWETGSEVGTAGFNLYRTPAWEPGEAVKVNPVLIPSVGDETVGARYHFEDRDRSLVPGRRYQYQIEEVEWDGGTTLYPDTVTSRAGVPEIWARFEGAALIAAALILVLGRLHRTSAHRNSDDAGPAR